MKTWKLTVNEEELRALINHHAHRMLDHWAHDIETSSRIHDLTKRLNKEVSENDPTVTNAFTADGAAIGSQLIIKLPSDYKEQPADDPSKSIIGNISSAWS